MICVIGNTSKEIQRPKPTTPSSSAQGRGRCGLKSCLSTWKPWRAMRVGFSRLPWTKAGIHPVPIYLHEMFVQFALKDLGGLTVQKSATICGW